MKSESWRRYNRDALTLELWNAENYVVTDGDYAWIFEPNRETVAALGKGTRSVPPWSLLTSEPGQRRRRGAP